MGAGTDCVFTVGGGWYTWSMMVAKGTGYRGNDMGPRMRRMKLVTTAITFPQSSRKPPQWLHADHYLRVTRSERHSVHRSRRTRRSGPAVL